MTQHATARPLDCRDTGIDRKMPVPVPMNENKDHFVTRDGVEFAGTHLILDLWGAERLDDEAHIETALREIVTKANATLLHIHLHRFTPNGGISGVAVLAESHISVHTWPERGYAAFDVFMCGDAVPHVAIEALRAAFRPSRLEVGEHRRGMVDAPAGTEASLG